ncbi:MAG: DUF2249 domain-containing protein [Rhodopseudomonas sp.]|uniref:DUF2249 domain-containing protein n=1 Tax=Rhodopseudomonas sp. TaxID=1078 RepID=UPI001820CB13|nr:DUF2249 domain-containing protein [Rhodopseudomonas sp.]NVN84873.1 DUF2249 domain-containing protein [Rhodopseudomonas sp.]
MPEAANSKERVLDVRAIEPRQRHEIIPKLFYNLGPDDALQLIVDHDPRPLHGYLEAVHGDGCQWTYLEQGPDVWRVRLRRLAS